MIKFRIFRIFFGFTWVAGKPKSYTPPEFYGSRPLRDKQQIHLESPLGGLILGLTSCYGL